MGGDPAISVNGRNASVLLTLTDPFEAQRNGIAPSSATEQYRTMFTLNGEAAP
jgi:hypothetical protein